MNIYYYTFLQHNVKTLLASERVIVLHEGKIVEDGKPADLQLNPDGYFSSLIQNFVNWASWIEF